MMRSSSFGPVLAVTIVLAIAGQASATVIFDTFGPGDAYGTSPYMVGAAFGSPYIQCAAFTVAGPEAYRLDSVEVALSHLFNGPAAPDSANEVAVQLRDAPTGTIIEEFNFTNQMQPYGPGLPPLVGTSVVHPVLTPGVQYWLVAYAPTYGVVSYWSDSDPAVYGWTQTLGTGIPQPMRDDLALPAFRINGTPVVPAPGALALSLLGLAITRRAIRRDA